MIDCPWSAYVPQIDTYPVCEERLCAWIVEPANTWTNIGYLIVAILIWHAKGFPLEPQRLFFRGTLFLFIASTVFHATGTHLGKLADVSAMFVLSAGFLSLALKRTLGFSNQRTEIFLHLPSRTLAEFCVRRKITFSQATAFGIF